MENVVKKSNKSIDEYRHNIKLLKYHLKKQQKINETLRYKDSKKNKKESMIKQKQNKQKHNLYSMLQIVNMLNLKLKDMGLSLGDIFRMADCRYQGEVTKQQFMSTITKLKANLQENQINQMFYAIDSNLNGMLSSDQYSQFLWAHGGSQSKQALTFQKQTCQKFMAILKKKNIKASQLIKNLLNPIPLEDMNTQLKKLALNVNQIMILFKLWDPSLTGFIKHQVYLKSIENVKQKDEKQIQNQKYQKGIKQLCVLFRDKKINPVQIFEQSDVDGTQGITVYELEQGFKKVMPDQTPFQIKKWISIINVNGDNSITKQQFVSAIRSFYSLQQIDNFSVQYQKVHPKLKKLLAQQQIPAQKIINQLSIIIEDNGFTKTQVFHKIDINHNGFIDKTQLLDGLKSLGINIVLIGKVLAVFDRDASGEVGLDQWLTILGEDLQMENVDIPEKDVQEVEKVKPKNTKKQEEKPPSKVSAKKQESKTLKQTSKPKVQTKKSTKQENIKASKKKNQQAANQKKVQPEKKPKKVAQASSVKKQSQVKALKDQDKNKTNKTNQAKQLQSKQKSVKEAAKKKNKEPQNPFPSYADQQQHNVDQQKQQQEINTNDIQRQIAQTYSKSPTKVKDLFTKCKQNKKKEGLNEKELSQFIKELRPKNQYNDKIVNKIFEDNCQSMGLVTFTWLQRLIDNFQLTIAQEKVEPPQQKIIPNKNKKQSKKETVEPIKKQEPKNQEQVDHQDYDNQFQQNESEVKNKQPKGNESQAQKQTNKRGENKQAFKQLEQHKIENQTMSEQGYKLKDYIENQKQMQLLANKYIPQSNSIKKNKKIYQDKTFPANLSSLTHLTPDQSQIPNVTLLKWKHYKEIYKNPQLFKDSISPNDIRQGTLGDCYFLCSLAALAQYKKLIQRLFEYYDIDNGYFLIWLCIDGSWKLVELDGYIPVSPTGNKPAFSHGDEQELWVILLEKAYAKVYGNYEKINGGQPYEAIKDLSGAPGQSFSHTNKEISMDDIWSKLLDANKQQFMMTCGTDANNKGDIKMEGHSESITTQGLVLGHAYSILDVRQYKKQRLIQLRNPWGETQWKGDWSDQSNKWTPQAKKQLNYQTSKQDGIFWMPFEVYFQKYNTTAINYIRPSYYYSSQQKKEMKSFMLIINQKSFKHGFIMVAQKDHRKDGLPPNSPYTMNHMIALEYQKGKIIRQISNQKYLYQREGSIQISSSGSSQVIVLVSLQQKTNITLCSYTDAKFTYEINEESERFMQCIQDIATMQQKAKNVQILQNLLKSWLSSVGQQAFFVFKSIAKKPITIEVNLTSPSNIELIPKNNKVVLKIKPGESKCIKGRILNMKVSYGFGPFNYRLIDN